MNLESNIEKLEKKVISNAEKIEDNASRIEKNSWALEILKDYKSEARRLFAIIIVILIMWFATIGIFVYYINTTGYQTVTEEVSTDDGGNACIGDSCNNGEINYGESKKNNQK